MTETGTASLANIGPFGSTSVFEMARRIRQGATTALEITEETLHGVFEHGTELNCFNTVDAAGAVRAARDADRELATGQDRGPLHGIPVAVKDTMATKGLRTTMGSRHFEHHTPEADAHAVALLRKAGAVVIGKTHAHEFAFGATGDQAHTGPALNPHDTSRITGGSSSGSAAAVAAGLVPIALGSDTAGSARIPAALCGVVGLRPTAGSVSLDGVFPLSPSMDVVSPIARSIDETAAAWWALSSKAQYSYVTPSAWSQDLLPDPARAADLRITQVNCNLIGKVASARQLESLELAINALARTGTIGPCLRLAEIDECNSVHRDIMFYEAYQIHSRRMVMSPSLFQSEVFDQLHTASKVTNSQYRQALNDRTRLRARVLERLSSVDILILPTVPINAPLIGQRELEAETGWGSVREALKAFTAPWSLLNFPAISIPLIADDTELPCSVQLVGKPGRERQVLDVASALELAVSQRAGFD